MRPQINQHVKLYFTNGLILEGFVTAWDIANSKASIKSLDSTDYFIINKLDNVMAIKVCTADNIITNAVQQDKKQIYVDKELETNEREPNLRAMKLAELRKLRGREERELARKMMTTFTAPGASFDYTARYGIPRKLQSEPVKHNTSKESRARNTANQK